MKKEVFEKLIKKLEGLEYCFISGFAIHIYNRKKKFKDIDIVFNWKDVDKFAERMGCEAANRHVVKGGFAEDDYGFETNFLGQPIEAVAIKRLKRIFKHRVKKIYLGKEIYVAPIEEILALKAFLHRDKDISDLKLLKNQHINPELLKKFAEDWGKEKSIIKLLKKVGYN
jgi:hypothetical protein